MQIQGRTEGGAKIKGKQLELFSDKKDGRVELGRREIKRGYRGARMRGG